MKLQSPSQALSGVRTRSDDCVVTGPENAGAIIHQRDREFCR